MKLHLSYNAFNGLEFLEANVRNMRPVVDVITVLWQKVSNYGNQNTEGVEALVDGLLRRGLIDKAVLYNTDLGLPGPFNELKKRNLGLHAARAAGCTHHLDIDVDEFYFQQQVQQAKVFVEQRDLQASYCRIVEYHKDIQYQCKQLRKDLHAPFIMKADSELKMRAHAPVLLDPKRRAKPNDRFHIFGPDELLMHHYSLVRKDFTGKLKDANNHRNNVERLKAVEHFDMTKYHIVPNQFNI